MPLSNLEVLSQIPLQDPNTPDNQPFAGTAARPQSSNPSPAMKATPSQQSLALFQRLTAVLQAIAMVLAVRFALMLSLIGAFYLTLMSFRTDNNGLWIAVSYDLLVFVPMVMLAWKRGGRE